MSPFDPIRNLRNGFNNSIIGAATKDPVMSGIGSAQISAGKDQAVGTTVALGTAAALPVVAAGATSAATSGTAATLVTAASSKLGVAATVVAGAATKAKDVASDVYAKAGALVTSADNAIAGTLTKAKDIASDLYAKTGALAATAENAKGVAGFITNIGIGIGKQVANDGFNAQGDSQLGPSGPNAKVQAIGMLIGSVINAIVQIGK